MVYMYIYIYIYTYTRWDVIHIFFKVRKYFFLKNTEILSFARTWINMEDIMLSEISQTEKHKHCMWNYKHLKVIFFKI